MGAHRYGRVVRQVTSPGDLFPHQEYYCASRIGNKWTGDRDCGESYPWQEAVDLAGVLTQAGEKAHAVTLEHDGDLPMPAREFSILGSERRDWHAGKPNCGVD